MSRIQSYSNKSISGGVLDLLITNPELRNINAKTFIGESDKDSELIIKDSQDNTLFQMPIYAYETFQIESSTGFFDIKDSITVSIKDSTDLAYINVSIEWSALS
jgi:hypothetical protein